MTRREIMVRAHEVARTMEGDYSARMALALRQAWFEARLIAMGGRLWEKHGYRRIYLNNLTELYGLEYDTYNTGNISAAWVDGKRISNNSARQIASMLYNGKLWYDLNSGRFDSKGLSETAIERITTTLGRAA